MTVTFPAHWHHYWTGPRDSAGRRLVLKWLHPNLVKAEKPEDLVPTVRLVRWSAYRMAEAGFRARDVRGATPSPPVPEELNSVSHALGSRARPDA